ncbi:MAG: outer membrane protein assembly factor BamE [Magnetococcus sp. DMHC-8]
MVRLTRYCFLFLLPLSFALFACQAVVHEKGTMLDPKAVAQIRVGVTTRAQVKDLLGVPTVVNTYRRDRWTYVQDRQYKNVQRTFARVINRVEITFDGRGVVQDIQHNFDDELLNPEHLPEARNQQNWFAWLWGGEYMRPAVEGRASVGETEATGKGESSLNRQEGRSEQPRTTNPWWRFWSSNKE